MIIKAGRRTMGVIITAKQNGSSAVSFDLQLLFSCL